MGLVSLLVVILTIVLPATSLQSAIDTVEKLEVKLSEFAKRHQSEIQNDPVFRFRFFQMCAPLGIDPLASKNTVFGKLTGMGDFYHELAVRVAEVCLASRSRNGGIMSIVEIQNTLKKKKSKLGMTSQETQVSVADLQIAIQKLGKLGGGFRTIQVGDSIMVVSVPTELDSDHMEVMKTAQELGEGVTVDDVMKATGWKQQRASRAVDVLLQEGMAWEDNYKGETFYWFTSLWQEQKELRKEEA